MWFLEADTAARLLIACALWAIAGVIARKHGAAGKLNRFLVLLDLALIASVSWELAVFYAAYTLLSWALCRATNRIKRGRKLFFVLFCVLCASPFLYVRARELFSSLPLLFALTGIAYNCLKAIDGVYFSYYTGEEIPLVTWANYMLFFPVVTAGPIMRYRDFAASLENPLPVYGGSLTVSFKRLIRGYFKKVVVLSLVTGVLNRLVAAQPRLLVSLFACAVSYALLWLDMSGYADIAIAMGGFVGVAVPENFKKPLRAASFTQFWRNWHVSLTDWIREHIFVVLNGKKLSRYQGAAIGFCTMMIMNMWHGFSAVFLADGLINGTLLAVENLFSLTTVNKRRVSKPYYIFRCCLTNLIFAFTTLFYTLDTQSLLRILSGFVRL